VQFIDCSYQTLPDGLGFQGMLLMEYCTGGRVVDLINDSVSKGRPLSPSLIMKIFTSLLNGVAHLHSRSPPIAHRDIKTANVLFRLLEESREVGDNGDGAEFKLCDFGSCTTRTLSMTASQKDRSEAEDDIQRNTTLEYRAPEQVNIFDRVVVDSKVDIWALGCFLYQMCFNRDAFSDKMNIMSGQYVIPQAHAVLDTILQLISKSFPRDSFGGGGGETKDGSGRSRDERWKWKW